MVLSVSGITVDITGYKGDGTISKEGAGFLAKGYMIDFGALKINGNEYSGRYKVDSIPKLNRDADLCIKIGDKYDIGSDSNKYAGSIKLMATDSNGNTIFSIESNLSEWTMTSLNGDNSYLYYLGDNASTGFDYRKSYNHPIHVDVQYKPDDKSILERRIPIHLVLQAGGSI